MPPAPPIPQRPAIAPYHYHAYTYLGQPGGLPPAPFAPSALIPGRGQFYSLVQDLRALLQNGQNRNVPNIAMGPVPGGAQTAGGRNTLMVSFGNLANAPNLPTVVFTGGIHAREWIATEFAYLLAEYLIGNYPVGVPANPRVRLLKWLVDNRNIRIIPMLNPDGNNRTVYGIPVADRMWRKNTRQLPGTPALWQAALAPGGMVTYPFATVTGLPPSATYRGPDFDPVNHIPPNGPANYRPQALGNAETGVDGNRNMATPGWGFDSAPTYDDKDPHEDTYFGTSAGGEPENANLQLAMALAPPGGWLGNIAVSIDYHSYGQMILYPDELPPGAPDAAYQRTGRLMRLLIRANLGVAQYTLGGFGVGYLSTGTIDSYSAQAHHARAFTIELDPSNLAGGGFVLPEAQIQAVFEKNIRGALAAIAAPAGLPAQQATFNALAPWAVTGAGNQVPP
jgi:Zinc carboxypeptidase